MLPAACSASGPQALACCSAAACCGAAAPAALLPAGAHRARPGPSGHCLGEAGTSVGGGRGALSSLPGVALRARARPSSRLQRQVQPSPACHAIEGHLAGSAVTLGELWLARIGGLCWYAICAGFGSWVYMSVGAYVTSAVDLRSCSAACSWSCLAQARASSSMGLLGFQCHCAWRTPALVCTGT